MSTPEEKVNFKSATSVQNILLMIVLFPPRTVQRRLSTFAISSVFINIIFEVLSSKRFYVIKLS